MDNRIGRIALDRRVFLGGGAATFFALPHLARAQMTAAAPTAKKPSKAIADFITGFDLKAAPPLAIERARLAFVDTVGVMLAGSRMAPSDIVCEMVRQEGATPAASIVGQSLRSSPQLAALANGVASHCMDYDFSYLTGQTCAPVIPALLPLAEARGATPTEVLAAFIVGFEVASRVSRANPTQSTLGGWHAVGTIGGIGAAAACASLIKAPNAAIPNIIGISLSLASGVSSNFGTMTKPLHAGHAAQCGVMAALLGSNGFTASDTAMEGNAGYFADFARGLDWSLTPFADLGSRYDLAEWGFTLKPYPCGGLGHTAIDAALAVREALGAKVADIASVKVGTTKFAAARISSNYPVTIENAKFSLPFLMAYALLYGPPRIAAFTEEAIADEKTRALAKLVSGSIDPEFGNEMKVTPGRVTVTLKDGESVERMKVYNIGTTQVPMSPAQVEAKFMDCATRAVSEANAQKIFADLNELGSAATFAEFWPLVRRA
jgi:2-methylcitrate dehydratase PrpD